MRAGVDQAQAQFRQSLAQYEQTVLTDEQTEAQISGQRPVDSVAPIKALGGGWEGQAHP